MDETLLKQLAGIIGFFGFTTGFCAATLLALGRHRQTVRAFGSAFFYLFATILLLFSTFLRNRYADLPHLAFLHLPVSMLVGPIIFYFLRSVSDPDAKTGRRALLHLILPILVPIGIIDIYTLPAKVKMQMMAPEMPQPEYLMPRLRLAFLIAYAYPLIYLVASSRYIRPYFSRLAALQLGFLRAMRVFLLICSTATAMMISIVVFGDSFYVKLISLTLYTIAMILAFLALARYPHFPELLARDARRYDRLKGRGSNKLKQLEQLLRENRLFADENLRVADLAGQLGLRGDQLSQLINDQFGVNFNRYINRLRIEDAKRRLTNSPELGVLRAAYECGFATKSAFNAAFKLETGVTPTQYIKNKNMRPES